MTRGLRIAVLAVAVAGIAPALAQEAPFELRTNESDIAAAVKRSPLSIHDPVAVFAFVMSLLPERVQVYPSENYYYFRFVNNGVRYDGNIRLAASNRDRGEVNFSYNEQITDWNDRPTGQHAALGAKDGVTVEKLAPLLYRVSLSRELGGKSVTFALNDLSLVKPPLGVLTADEKFIGASFDESGYRFYLVFNTRLKVFHFFLDETVPTPDVFTSLGTMDRILIGKRSGFAFYQWDGRKILIGVSARQSELNTMFDGPFDQLPENFIEGETLREAIIAADPRAGGKIDRLGLYADGDNRYLIHPYLPYRRLRDLAVVHRCAATKPAAERPRCFVFDDEETRRPNPRPLALKHR